MNKFIVLGLILFGIPKVFAQADDLNTQLMFSTFKISNPKSSATVFILNRPAPNAPDKTQSILITAAHVLEGMEGNDATLILRKKFGDGEYEKAPMTLKIRDGGKAIWTKHPTEDVAVMLVSLPPGIEPPCLSTDILATDESLKTAGVHPGQTIRCAGYPHASQFNPSAAGFPLIRIGCIASFPLLPTSKTKTFLIDLNTFEGDSGAPVYIVDESVPTIEIKERRGLMLIGLVHGQHFLDENFKTIYQSGQTKHRLGIGIIVHATAIKTAIGLLP